MSTEDLEPRWSRKDQVLSPRWSRKDEVLSRDHPGSPRWSRKDQVLSPRWSRKDEVLSRDPAPTAPTPLWRRVVRTAAEAALLLACWTAYELGRNLAKGHRATAVHHAELVHRAEAALHLPDEASLQALFPVWAFRAADTYYVSMHFAMMGVFLAWGFFRRPRAEYVWARNLLILQTAGALAVHVLYPLAPPRMFPQWGFVDTMSTYGPSAYGGDTSGGFTNQYAAMPSLHVGWAVLIFYVVARTGPRFLAVLAGLYAATTLTVVVVTANHWWLDAVAGVVLLALADLVLRRTRPDAQLRR